MPVLLWVSAACWGLALALPLGLDPVHPLGSPAVAALVIAAGVAGIVGIVAVVRQREWAVLGTWAAVLTVTTLLVVLLAPQWVYAGTTLRLLATEAAALLSGTALLTLVRPRPRAWLLFAATGLNVVVVALWTERPPQELEPQSAWLVKRACRLAPGYGPSNVGTILQRKLRPQSPDTYQHTLLQAADGLAEVAREPQAGRWRDDARVVRAFLLRKAAAPTHGAERVQRLATVVEALLDVAAHDTELEPWTARGPLATDARTRLEDLRASDGLKIQIAAAEEALRTCVSDELSAHEEYHELETRALERVRSVFDEHGLDPTHPVYLTSMILEAGRYRERGEWLALIAFYDRMLEREWPETIRAPMQRERDFVSRYQSESDALAMWFRAKDLRETSTEEAEAMLDELVRRYPDTELAELVRERGQDTQEL